MKGIYRIHCKPTDKNYIGQAVGRGGCSTRWKQHVLKLRKGVHGNPHLQSSWNKYGESEFTFQVLEECNSVERANSLEVEFIFQYLSYDRRFGFNLSYGGESSPMFHPATADKQRKTQNTAAFRLARSAQLKISHNTLQVRNNISLAQYESYSGSKGLRRRKKLSESLANTYSDPELRKRSSELRKLEWARDPERKKRFIHFLKTRKRVPKSTPNIN